MKTTIEIYLADISVVADQLPKILRQLAYAMEQPEPEPEIEVLMDGSLAMRDENENLICLVEFEE